MKNPNVAFYIRVSKSDKHCTECDYSTRILHIEECPQCGGVLKPEQSLENQLYELQALKQVEGWQDNVTIFTDTISGAKGREQRPGFDELLTRAEAGEFDIVAAWSVDRMGRDLIDLIQLANTARKHKFSLFFHKDRIDTSTDTGMIFFKFMGLVAEWERMRISDRTKNALHRLRAEGKILGRPKEASPEMEAAIVRLHKKGKGIHSIRKELGCGTSMVQRVIKQRGN